MTKTQWSLVFFMLLGAVLSTQAGTIRGRVTADRKAPVRGATIYVEDSKGQRMAFRTDEEGQFLVKNLPADDYTVWLEKAEGLETDVPECGYYEDYIDGDREMNFNAHTTGVAIDFGDPTGPGFAALADPSLIDFSVFMYNLNLVEADTIDILGYWYIPGQGKLDAAVIGGWPAGFYSASPMMVSYENLLGLLTHYTLRYNQPINHDGELATFRLKLTPAAVTKLAAANGKLAFCGVWVRMYRKGILVFDSTANWVGNRNDLGEVPTGSIRR